MIVRRPLELNQPGDVVRSSPVPCRRIPGPLLHQRSMPCEPTEQLESRMCLDAEVFRLTRLNVDLEMSALHVLPGKSIDVRDCPDTSLSGVLGRLRKPGDWEPRFARCI